MCLSHPWSEVQERFLIELLELNTLNERFLFGKTIFDEVLKLAEEANSHYNVRKCLKFRRNLRKIPAKELIGINFKILSSKPKVCIVLLHMCL